MFSQQTLIESEAPAPKPKTYKVPVVTVQLIRERMATVDANQVRSPVDGYMLVKEELELADREKIVVVLLDSKLKVLGIHTVGVGSLNSNYVVMRDMFKAAVLANAAAIIVAHNHPSGDPTPSPEDIKVTEQVAAAGHLLDIDVMDHLVVAVGGYRSIKTLFPNAFDKRVRF